VLSGAAQQAGAIPPPGGARAAPPPAGQPVPPRQETARPLSGMRGCLAARSARRAARHAAHGAAEAPRGMPPEPGRAHAAPAPAGPGLLPAPDCSVPRPLDLLRRARPLRRAAPLFPLGHGRCVYMAPPARRPAEQRHLGAISPGARPRAESATLPHRSQAPESDGLRVTLCTAEARTTEEPEAGTLPVRVCTGGAG
jgi:hypothetical protein